MKKTNTMEVKDYLKKGTKTGKRASPEHDAQVMLFEWADVMSSKYPELKLLFAIPNGGQRNIIVATRMKDEGVKSGVPDVFLAVPFSRNDKVTKAITSMKAGLFIEMKAGKNKPSDNQAFWIKELQEVGYQVEICYSGQEAVDTIIDYLMLDEEKYEK